MIDPGETVTNPWRERLPRSRPPAVRLPGADVAQSPSGPGAALTSHSRSTGSATEYASAAVFSTQSNQVAAAAATVQPAIYSRAQWGPTSHWCGTHPSSDR
ncbi:hypothetical protein NKG05_20775 [Oerskovia sp. M15]